MSVKIYVGNLSYGMSESSLEELFSRHGKVMSVKIISDQYSGKSKGFGFVEMEDKDEAQNAIKQINGTECDGRNIKVNVAKPRSDDRRPNR